MNEILNINSIKDCSTYLAGAARNTFKVGICTTTAFIGTELANNLYELHVIPYIYKNAQLYAQENAFLGTQWMAGHMAGQAAVVAARSTFEPASRMLGCGLGLLAGIIIANTALLTADITVNAITRISKNCFPQAES
ncbi:MAG: hypothetical protein Q8L98_02505 [Chlamydiales bacterium]|nr:hypothetical protein [Chlamydiales bacterium]